MDAIKFPAMLKVTDLGHQEYVPIWKCMQELTDKRTKETTDELWFVEHPPVFTQGQAGKAEHILASGNIPVVQVDRGGQVTYHGPGQMVVYPMIDLKRHKIGIKALVNGIEEAVIQTLLEYKIIAKRKKKAPGVYVDDKKIASLGLRVRKGCTFHGLAFNILMDLEPFARINPCGFAGLEVVQLSQYVNTVKIKEVQQKWLKHFCKALNFQPQLETSRTS